MGPRTYGAALVLATCIACAHPPRPSVSPVAAPSPLAAAGGTAGTTPWVDSVLGAMSLRDKAAQMVWPSPLGNYTPTDSHEWRVLLHDIQDEHVGGVSISFGSPIEMAAKLNALQRAAPLPLLVGSDLEYGAGQRARGGYFVPNGVDLGGATVFPPEMAFGATRDTTLAYAEGTITAREGRALGISIDYAPVLDVNINAANPVINTRSFGESPALDAAFGRAVIRGLQDHGMTATGKHFPGHGDTETNSHLALPIVRVSRARLDTVELVPFRAAIGAGVGAIMSFHGSMPALDSSGVPGTLSRAVLTDLLRGELGFHGVIISDAMDMRGVLDQFGAVEAAKRAVAAGADVLIQPEDVAQTIDAVVAGVHEGRYPESRLDASVRRLLTMKEAAGLVQNRLVDLDSVRAIVGDSANEAVAQTVADRSITVVRDSAHLLPLGRLTPGARVLVMTIAHRPDLAAGGTFVTELRRRFPSLRAEYVDADDPVGTLTRLRHVADSSDVTIVCSYITQNWQATSLALPTSIAAFIQDIMARRGGGGRGGGGGGGGGGNTQGIVVAFGNPYLLAQVPDVPTYVVAWGGFPVSQRAAARALLGTIPVTGQLPISIPPEAPFGAGLQIPVFNAAAPAR